MVQKKGLFLKEKRKKNYQGQKFTYSFELKLPAL